MDYLNNFANWYSSAKKGDSYTYYYGFLCKTREALKAHDELNMLADQLWRMAEVGKISLVQRRAEKDKFAYIVQKVK